MIVLRLIRWLLFVVAITAVFVFGAFIIYKSSQPRPPRPPLPETHRRTPAEVGEGVGRTGTQFGKGVVKGVREELTGTGR